MATAQGGDWDRLFVMKGLDDGSRMVSIATFLDDTAIHSPPCRLDAILRHHPAMPASVQAMGTIADR